MKVETDFGILKQQPDVPESTAIDYGELPPMPIAGLQCVAQLRISTDKRMLYFVGKAGHWVGTSQDGVLELASELTKIANTRMVEYAKRTS